MDKELMIGCDCGYYHYVHLTKFEDEREVYLAVIDMPTTFWERVKKLLGGDTHWREIVLNRADMKKMVEFLNQCVDP